MKQVKLLLLFVVAFAMLLAACTNSPTEGGDPSPPPNAADSETEEVLEPPKPTTSAGEKVLVSVDYATDELLNNYDSYIEFEDESAQKIVFTTNMTVKEFNFIEVAYRESDMEIAFFENKVLYSLEELSPAKPFAVSWMEQGAIPHRGISFIDESDTARYFYIATSGEDGSLLLVEFKNE